MDEVKEEFDDTTDQEYRENFIFKYESDDEDSQSMEFQSADHEIMPTVSSSSNSAGFEEFDSTSFCEPEFSNMYKNTEQGEGITPPLASTSDPLADNSGVPRILATYSVATGQVATTGELSDEEILPDQSDAFDYDRPARKKRNNRKSCKSLFPSPRRCGVTGCGSVIISGNSKGIAAFRLPNNMKKRHAWLQNIKRMDLLNKPANSIYVCEKHFHPKEIVKAAKRKFLKSMVVPMLNLPQDNIPNDCNVDVQASIVTVNNSSQFDDIIMESKAVQVTFNDPEGLDVSEIKKRIAECKKRLHSVENGAHKTQKRAFDNWCDRFLPDHLAEIAKGQANLKFGHKGNRYDLTSKALAISLYYTSKEAYELVSKDLRLPNSTALEKMLLPISTEYNEDTLTAFKIKVDDMTEHKKYCSVIVDLMKIKASLGYLAKSDKITGVHDINGRQCMEPAQYAIVLIVRGILDNWYQPIAFGLLSETKRHLQVSEWIDMYLSKLLAIGLKVKTLVTTFKSDQLNEIEIRQVSVDKPYFFVDGVKIYYICDVPDLLIELRNSFLEHDFYFEHEKSEGMASIKHITDLLQHDLQQELRLIPKLTPEHVVNPDKSAKNQVRYAAQLFSQSVATALQMRIDFDKVADGFEKCTVDFLLLINNLFDTLNSTSINGPQFKKAFCGDENQVNLLKRSLEVFESLKVSEERLSKKVAKPYFSKGFQITIKSILLLLQDLKEEGHIMYLPTRNLTLGVSRKFFKDIRTKTDNTVVPTSKGFISLFQRSFVTHILQLTNDSNCSKDLATYLIKLNENDTIQDDTAEKTNRTPCSTPQTSLRSVSDTLFVNQKFSLETNIREICDILLKGCLKHHAACVRLKVFVDLFNVEFNSDENNVMPIEMETISPMYFVSFVELMEKEFLESLNTFESKGKVGLAAYEKIENLNFATPCPCFPTNYLKALFIRLRIFMIVNYNSEVYRLNNFVGQSVVIPKIQSIYA